MKQKKGVSPLIAVVLLIAIVVGLGTVLMTMSRDYITQTSEGIDEKIDQQKCDTDVQLEFVPVNGKNVCYNSVTDDYEFTLQSGPYIDVEGIQVTGIGTSGANPLTLAVDKGINKGAIEKFGIQVDSGYNDTIRIVPTITLETQSEPLICTSAEITFNTASIKDC